MITRIEEVTDLQDIGIDLIRFHVYLKGADGQEVRKPLIVYMSDIRKYMQSHDPQALTYLLKVNDNIRCYGAKDHQVLKTFKEDGFSIRPFVEKYVKAMPADKIFRHIQWSQSIEYSYSGNDAETEDLLTHPDLAENTIRRNRLAGKIDELIQKAVKELYPEFFQNSDSRFNTRYDYALMKAVDKLANELDDFFFRESEAKK
ncbi:MAG: hypothetical protein ACOVRK_05575 [Chryseobacterium taeanense]